MWDFFPNLAARNERDISACMITKRNILYRAYNAAVAIAILLVCSCDKVNSELGDVPVDYREYFDATFQFNDSGECYYSTAQPITRAQFESAVVGKGWKHLTSNEINAKGKMQLNDFYSNIYGLSPSHLYFNSAKDLTLYSFSDALNKYCYSRTAFEYKEDGNEICADGNDLRILSIEDEGTMLYVIQSVGMVYDDDKFTNIYCLSIYKRMSDEELSAYQSTYTNEI